MRNSFIIIFIFFAFSCTEKKKYDDVNNSILIQKINSSSNYLDLKSIEDHVLKLKYDSLVRNNLDLISDKYYDLEKFEDYYRVSEILVNQSKKISDTIGIIEGLCKKGAYFSNAYKIDSMYYYYTKAENYSVPSKEKHLLGTIFLNKAVINQNLNDYYNSEKNSFEALKILKDKNDFYLLYNTYLNIGYATFNQNDTKEALKYFGKALQITDKIKNKKIILSLKGQVYYYYCMVFDKNNNYKSSYEYALKGLSLDDFKVKDPHVFCNLNNCLGYAKFKLNDKNSIDHFLESLEIAKKTNNILAENISNLYLSEYYLKQNNNLKGIEHANEVINTSKENNLYDDQLKALLLLAKSNPSSATKYFESYKKLSDSIVNIERQTRDKFARIDYQTNEIISEKETIEKQKDNIVQQLWSVSTIAVFIILAVLLFYFIKSRNLKNKELIFIQEQQNAKEEIYELMLNQQQRIEEGKYSEKNRISQELHDGIMGKLTGIRLNLFILKKKQDVETVQKCLPFIDDIQNIEKEIRQITHDLKQNLFDDNITFSSIVENLFTMIKSHSDIDFSLQIDDRIDWDLINNNKKINIYRIIQEALQNIDKYAQASKVNINMNKIGEEIHITISDNGIGFVPKQGKKGIGLENMQARMDEINGKFHLESKINFGTKISLTFQI